METNSFVAWVNSGRSTMKMEVLNKIWRLLEDAAQQENEQLVKTLYWVHEKVQEMPIRIQDKPQAMLEEIESCD